MKLKIWLTTLAFIAATTPVFLSLTAKAQFSTSNASCIREPEMFIAPGTLVQIAYQGALQQQGIPSAGGFIAAYKSGKVNAQSLVKAAVTGCLLSNKMDLVNNQGYLDSVSQQLQIFNQSR